MAKESDPSSLNGGSRIWRFLAYNAIATTVGAVVFALTFQNVLMAVVLTMTALLIGLVVIFREMWTLLGSDDHRMSEAEPVASPVTLQAARHAERTDSARGETPHTGGASLAH